MPDDVPLFFIVDDDLEDLEMLIEAIAGVDRKIQCLTASSGSEAIRKLQSMTDRIPDCIILDINMPRINGLECLALIRNIIPLASVPAVIYSTTISPSDVTRGKHLGAIECIRKSTHLSDLIIILQKLTKRLGKIK